jgi:glycosyltransferase involved in cell wall biosynthesis
MPKRTEILVIGGGNLERGPAGEYVTKVPIADYLHELSDRLGHLVWFVDYSGTWGVVLEGTNTRVKGVLDPEKVTVVAVNTTARGTLRNTWLFLRTIIDRPYGVFFLPQVMTLVPTLPIATLMMKRFVVYLAGDYEVTLNDPEAAAGKWPGWKFFFRHAYEGAMRQAYGVIARGGRLASLARRCNDRVIETVPLGHMQAGKINEDVPLEDDAPRRLLYIGLLVESKGMNDFSSALKMVLDRRPNAKIDIDVLGDGPDLANFEAYASSLGIADHVHFHGWVESGEEIAAFFARAHALVMPTSTHPEGVPRSIDEALVRKIPVVATRIAGVPDEFANGEALLVDPSAPDQIADGIETLLYDREARARYIEGADRRRQQWTAFSSAAEQHAKYLRDGTLD